MGVEKADPEVTGSRPKGRRSWPLSAYFAALVALFAIGASANLVTLTAQRRLNWGLTAISLVRLLSFVVAALVLYRLLARPIIRLSAEVRAAINHSSAGPIKVTGAAEISSLVRDVNQMIAQAKADIEVSSRLAAIVESSADAVIGLTLDGVITSWNTEAQSQYGYSPNEIAGHNVAELIPNDRPDELTPILHAIRQGSMVRGFETKHVRKDGTIFDASVSFSPVRDDSGAVIAASSIVRDISDRVRLDADRRALEHQQQQYQRLESLGQLAGGIAHDFNNLLGIIINYADFVAEATTDSAAQADIGQIKAAAQRAAKITMQLLILGRRETAQPAALALNTVVADARDMLSKTVGEEIEIRVDPAAGLPTINADRRQVEQVILNLAANARDAMPQGGTLTIETSLLDVDERHTRLRPGISPGRYVELAMSDTGTGMRAEVMDHIFEPFFTTKPMGQGTSLGLGLATAYGIVASAGGTIGVYSEVGTGTTFRLWFPAAGAAATGVADPATPILDNPGARGSGQTILIVDDELSLLEITSRILRQNGYDTLEASTFNEALSLASSQDFQLLLTDTVMPHMSGPTLAERIGKLRPGRPVVYMSGYTAETLNPQRMAAEGSAFIQKPFTRRALLEKVNAALNPRLSR